MCVCVWRGGSVWVGVEEGSRAPVRAVGKMCVCVCVCPCVHAGVCVSVRARARVCVSVFILHPPPPHPGPTPYPHPRLAHTASLPYHYAVSSSPLLSRNVGGPLHHNHPRPFGNTREPAQSLYDALCILSLSSGLHSIDIYLTTTTTDDYPFPAPPPSLPSRPVAVPGAIPVILSSECQFGRLPLQQSSQDWPAKLLS